MDRRRSEFIDGIRAEAPLALGVVPFGLIYGAFAVDAGIEPLPAILMSVIVFAGSSQFIGARLIGAATSPWVVIATTFVVNLRHALYSLALAPEMRAVPRSWRSLLAYMLTDEAYAPTAARYASPVRTETRHWFFLGAALSLWIWWQISTIAGVLLGGSVPESWALDFTLALTFIGILVPTIVDKPRLAAALTAAFVAVVTVDFPNRTGLLLAAFTGIAVGVILDQLQQSAHGRTARA